MTQDEVPSPELADPDGSSPLLTEPELVDALAAQGFEQPNSWIDFARSHNFRRVTSSVVPCCPSCQAAGYDVVGQYVYYSTHIELRACNQCDLVYPSRQLAPVVIDAHFLHAYVDDTYFRNARRSIFSQIAGLVDNAAAQGARVLDVGGALGHLMEIVQRRRPDLHITIADANPVACEVSTGKGFATICAPFSQLDPAIGRFDVVVLSDVIYYETDFPRLWSGLGEFVAPGGTVIIRVPNRRQLIGFSEWLANLVAPGRQRSVIRFFNPEHLYIFSRRYLVNRLRADGFPDVDARPSAVLLPSHGGVRGLLAFQAFARLVHRVSFGRLILTPSMLIVARRASAPAG